jgi:hypothetical protein
MNNNRNNRFWSKKIYILQVLVVFLLGLSSVSFSQDCSKKLGSLPSVTFRSKSILLLPVAKASLAAVAIKLRNSPSCRIVVTGYCSSNKKEQQFSWDRVNRVIIYLVEKEGISSDRFIFNYGQEGGDCNTVDIRPAGDGEEGPNAVPPPHPNLRNRTN